MDIREWARARDKSKGQELRWENNVNIEKMRNASGHEQGSKLTFYCTCKVLLVRLFSTSKQTKKQQQILLKIGK